MRWPRRKPKATQKQEQFITDIVTWTGPWAFDQPTHTWERPFFANNSPECLGTALHDRFGITLVIHFTILGTFMLRVPDQAAWVRGLCKDKPYSWQMVPPAEPSFMSAEYHEYACSILPADKRSVV